ncbi:MAG: vitamin K epoxide reductase family protein [Myxococcales bacterium]|jgi:uncharacterized membrane protein
MRPHPALILLVLAACAGFAFAGFSTYDFVAHLDRQVHGVHCSFLPGLTSGSGADSAGCQATLMSPYSSVMRESIWGGIPISLPAMSVFAFLAFWGLAVILLQRQADRHVAAFTVAATALPVGASLVMGYLSLHELDAVCKLCIGIYAASALALGAALWQLSHARAISRLGGHGDGEGGDDASAVPLSYAALGLAFALGLGFVAVPVITYAAGAPDFSSYVGSCGELEHAVDDRVQVRLGGDPGGLPMVEVLDPLCPSCRGFEERFAEMALDHEVERSAVLFPLDDACNWMIDDAIHPGACAISEAMLCAEDDAGEVLSWAFANQEAIVEAERQNEGTAARMVSEAFPDLAGCVGSAGAAAELNLALRWAAQNRILVLTPQVYVAGLRLCDEDTDLGLDYALPRLIARAHTRPPPEPAPSPVQQLPLARTDAPRRPTRGTPEAQPATGTETGSETETETGAEAETESESEAETGAEPEPEPEPETETETETEPESETETEPENETGAGAETETEAETGAGAEPESESEPEPGPESDPPPAPPSPEPTP